MPKRSVTYEAQFAKSGDRDRRMPVVEAVKLLQSMGEIKTKKAEGVLKALQATKKTLVVDAASNEKLKLSVRNLDTAMFLPPEGVNVYDLLRHDHLVLTQDAAKALEARCLR